MEIYILFIISSIFLIKSVYDDLYKENHHYAKEKSIRDLMIKHSYKEKEKDIFCYDEESGYIYLYSLYDITEYI